MGKYMIELILFIFSDVENRLGSYHVLDQVFPTLNHCQEFVEEKLFDRNDIGMSYCAPLDTHKNISYNVGVITSKEL